MTQTPCAIDTCDRPVPDTCFVCPGCGDRLATLLGEVPGILDDLDDVIARQVRFTTGTTRGTDDAPLPFNPAGSDARYVLASTLRVWARLIAEQRGTAPTSWQPAALGPWLAGQVEWLRAQAAGTEAVGELDTAIRQARRVTDRPADRQYAGPCTAVVPDEDGLATACGLDLYARPGADTVECRACGTAYPLAGRRAWLLRQAEDVLLTAPDIARAVDGLGVQVSPKTVESWVRRGQLVARGRTVLPDGRSAATYRVGDVLDRVHGAAARRRLVAA